MLIGLDGIPLTFPRTGVGHYTAQLAHALAAIAPENHFRFIYPSSFPASSFQLDNPPANVTSVRVPVGPVAKHWWTVGLPRHLRTNPLNLFHGTNYDIPLWKRCPTVLTIHDLSQLAHPETHEKRSVRRARRRLPLMARSDDRIIVPTEPIRVEACTLLGLNEQKVFVVAEAAREFFSPVPFESTASTRDKFGIGDRFLLSVGTIEPRKNVPNLVAAFNLVAKSQDDLQLVIVGGKGWLSGPSIAAIENSPYRRRIVLPGYLHDDELRDLYSSCELFLYLSLYEGFGLPPIEAMACEAAVIASNIPVLVESTGGAAALVDPLNPEEIQKAIRALLESDSRREELKSAGRRRVGELSWKLAATKTLAVYEQVL